MEDQFAQRSSAFMSWLASIPDVTISPAIELADLRSLNAGRGVIALADIPADTDLFTIPRSSILSTETSELPKLLPDFFAEDPDAWITLTIVMIYEYLQGEKSIWKPYFDVLPTEFDTLMFWTEDELEELQASVVRRKIGKELADMTINKIMIPLIKKHAKIFYPQESPKRLTDKQLLALAHRFSSTIMSYAFDLEKDSKDVEVDEEGYASEEEDALLPKGMVPLADMLNSNASFNARLFYGPGTVTMRTTEDIKHGEEILNDYGHLPRSDMLRRYGYITDQYKPFDIVDMPIEMILKAVQEYRAFDEEDWDQRMKYLENKEVLDDGYMIYRKDAPPQDDDEDKKMAGEEWRMFDPLLVALLRILLADKSLYRGKFTSEGEERNMTLWMHVADVCMNIAVNRSSMYKTSIEEDTKMLQDVNVQGRLRQAIEVRLGEKEILRDMLEEASELKRKYKYVAEHVRPAKRQKKA